tara:strand:- start:36 stop:188 length:153 start_codon:yes stop_codon:yes gene_type:complete
MAVRICVGQNHFFEQTKLHEFLDFELAFSKVKYSPKTFGVDFFFGFFARV